MDSNKHSEHRQTEFRKNVVTPKRAREFEDEAVENELEEQAEDEEEKKEAEGYIKDPKKTHYRDSVVTPKRARELGGEPSAQEGADDEKGEAAFEKEAPKGTAAAIFEGEKNEAEQKKLYSRRSMELSTKSRRNRATVRAIICMGALTFFAVILQFMTVHVPFTPRLFTIEVSTLPELMAALAYGPLFGILICFIKNALLAIFVRGMAVSALTNMMLDSIFLFIAAELYLRLNSRKSRSSKRRKRKRYNAKKAFICGVAGAAVSLVPQEFITVYLAYPLLAKVYASTGFTLDIMLDLYKNSSQGLNSFLTERFNFALPEVKTLWQGVMIFNLPVTFAKLVIISFIAALLLKYLMPYLHYRKKGNEKKR